ncbi:Ribosomal RNA small subunit methyltransferase B [Piscirickettsiaceae bacterium NZ-RLO1]|nr:Ribosomal RNA small subunit methyltransferase B [Piscirickettsiaceae bacterium NZ-RLO1]
MQWGVVLVSKLTNIRALASAVLADVNHQGMSLPAALLKHNELLDEGDKSLLQELCFGSIRWYQRLDAICDQLLNRPLRRREASLKMLLIVGLYQLLFMRIKPYAVISETVDAVKDLKKPHAKGLVNAVLRSAQRQDYPLLTQEIAIYSHPNWLIKRCKRAWPEYWQDILKANNERPPMSLRVNQRWGTRQAYLQLLKQHDIVAEAVNIQDCTHAIRLEKPSAVAVLPQFSEGACSVQNEAAQLAAPLLDLKADLRVLDACAAPGGKSCHILELADAIDLVAVDVDGKRLQRVQENLSRLKLSAKLAEAAVENIDDWWDGVPFDRILLDAPCSGTGVIRRHPDIKLLRTLEDISQLHHLQLQLLTALWPCLKPGGVLVYATCSILPEENEAVIKKFLAEQAGKAQEVKFSAEWGMARPFGRQIFPEVGGMDGFYYAKLRKIANS